MSDTPNVEPVRTILGMTNAVAWSRAVHVVAELGVADTLGLEEESPVATMAARCGCDADALHRLLRLLECHGVFASERDCWSHTPASAVLRSDHPMSMRPYARMIGQPGSWDAMTHLVASVRTGLPAPFLVEAGGTFGYLQQHPDQLHTFDQAMIAKTHADIAEILGGVDFGPYSTIVDVGGGRGHLLRAIVESTGGHGTLFDLPHVVAEVDDPSITGHGGDFFADPLPTGDLSILMQVLHDWNDTDVARILAAVAAANEPGSTLMVFEWILPEQPTDDSVNLLDIWMLAVTGGRERTAGEFTTLLEAAGYDVLDIRPLTALHVIEARHR